jgi:hypothetical protein
MSETTVPLFDRVLGIAFYAFLIFWIHYRIVTFFPFKSSFRPCCVRFYSLVSCGLIRFTATSSEQTQPEPQRPLVPGPKPPPGPPPPRPPPGPPPSSLDLDVNIV